MINYSNRNIRKKIFFYKKENNPYFEEFVITYVSLGLGLDLIVKDEK